MFEGLLIDNWNVGIGYENVRSDIDYNIAGGLGTNGDSAPNVLSELKFRGLDGGALRVTVGRMVQVNDDLALALKLNYGKSGSLGGAVRDEDYNSDNRTDLFSDSQSSTAHSKSSNWSVDGQMKFRWGESVGNYWGLNLGTSNTNLKIKLTDGKQIVPVAEPIENLHSTYNPEYKNTKIGIFTEHLIGSVFLSFGYDKIKTDFDATGDWNLRTDYAHPISYKQSANGYGTQLTIAVTLPVSEHIDTSLSAQRTSIKVNNGFDQIFSPGGDSLATRLNGNSLKSNSISLSLSYHF